MLGRWIIQASKGVVPTGTWTISSERERGGDADSSGGNVEVFWVGLWQVRGLATSRLILGLECTYL